MPCASWVLPKVPCILSRGNHESTQLVDNAGVRADALKVTGEAFGEA